jgi:hypothetical protein
MAFGKKKAAPKKAEPKKVDMAEEEVKSDAKISVKVDVPKPKKAMPIGEAPIRAWLEAQGK